LQGQGEYSERPQARKKRGWRETAARRWGQSTKPPNGKDPEIERRMRARSAITNQCIDALSAAIPQTTYGNKPIEREPTEGDLRRAARIAVVSKLAVQAADEAHRLLDAEIRTPIWRWFATPDDHMRIAHALKRFPPEDEDWSRAADFLKVVAIRLPGDPADVTRLRLTSGFDPAEAIPIDSIARALCEALQWVFRFHNLRESGAQSKKGGMLPTAQPLREPSKDFLTALEQACEPPMDLGAIFGSLLK
jgi:hypothetical protein